jgi:tetratricopeptide (TPR) repeat protein
MLDPRGNPVSTRSSAAVEATEQALWRMMSFYGTPIDDLAAAHATDPAWPLPLLMHAGFLLSLTEPSVLGDARALIERAEPLMAHANAREQAHRHALQFLLDGDWPAACAAWETLLLQHPRDALALQWAHLFDFYRGDATNLRQRVARVLPEWDTADALHPYVLGQYAFGLEECQLYAQAEETGRLALRGTAKVPWAIHAVAHVMEMQGRHTEGSAWMQHWHGDWAEGNGFAGHLGWHHALFALEALDHATALQHFDAHLKANPAQITLQRLDASALLWRLHLLGADVGPRWRELVAGWDLSAPVAGLYPFNDLHALLALIGNGELARGRDWVALAETQAAHPVARNIGLPLMHGMLAFAHGRFDLAIQTLYPARGLASRFGGSHAQRDLIDQTLIAAAARATDRSVGRALLNERRLAKPVTPLTAHWAARFGAA